jgi:hypothetical protein
VRHIYYSIATGLAVTASAFAYPPAEERDFGEFAATGCNNRDGDFVIRGLVSSVNEGMLVLADLASSRITTAIALPDRGPLDRVKGAVGVSKREAINQQLSELRSSRTPVVVTMTCEGDGTPLAVSISYTYVGGANGTLLF